MDNIENLTKSLNGRLNSLIEHIQNSTLKPLPSFKNIKTKKNSHAAQDITHLSSIVTLFFVLKDKVPKTIEEALQFIQKQSKDLVQITITELHIAVNKLVNNKKRNSAVISRVWKLWPWPCFTSSLVSKEQQNVHKAGLFLYLLLWLCEDAPEGELLYGQWPQQAAPADVVNWAKRSIVSEKKDFTLSTDWANPIYLHSGPINTTSLALLFLADNDITKGLSRPAIAIDANRNHHRLVSNWRDVPKDTRVPHYVTKDQTGAIELFGPEDGMQLKLHPEDNGSFAEAMVRALKDWRGWLGLRNWAALLHLFSIEGGRTGEVRWSLDDHMHALGYSERSRLDPKIQERIASEVLLLTKLELAIYDKSGEVRDRAPLIQVDLKRERRIEDSKWVLEGMVIRINTALYSGIRRGKQLSNNWFPAPKELPQVDQDKNRHAIVLGLVLPIRWRWALRQGKEYILISGENLLKAAAIKYSSKNPGRAWTALERDLTKLKEIGGLGSWEWCGEANFLNSNVKLYPAEWQLDRIVRKLRPLEDSPKETILTGHELRVWRRKLKLTQAQLAKRIGVATKTITRAEKAGQKKISTNVRKRLKDFI